MGRARDIERLETKVENDLDFLETHKKETQVYNKMQDHENEVSILKKYALLSILVTSDFINKI
jgi:hypothetical protein